MRETLEMFESMLDGLDQPGLNPPFVEQVREQVTGEVAETMSSQFALVDSLRTRVRAGSRRMMGRIQHAHDVNEWVGAMATTLAAPSLPQLRYNYDLIRHTRLQLQADHTEQERLEVLLDNAEADFQALRSLARMANILGEVDGRTARLLEGRW